jgi:hypothetical protein
MAQAQGRVTAADASASDFSSSTVIEGSIAADRFRQQTVPNIKPYGARATMVSCRGKS